MQLRVRYEAGDAVRQALNSYARLKVSEGRTWWLFWLTFNIEGPQDVIDKAVAEALEIEHGVWLDGQW
jgi:hypothetical protein